MVNRVNQVASEFRKVSNKQMAETTKRTIRDNVSINAQLDKMSDKTTELIAENDDLRAREKAQKQQIEMLEATEKEIIKKNHSNQKVKYVWDILFYVKQCQYRCDLEIQRKSPLMAISQGRRRFLESGTASERHRRSARAEGPSRGRAREGEFPPPLVRGVRGISPENFFKFKMSVEAILMHF